MEVKDLKLDSNDDLLFQDGDFVIKESDLQHQQDIILENVGAYKLNPFVGVGLIKYLNSSGAQLLLKRNIGIQLEADGYLVERLISNKGNLSNITVYAKRKKN